MLEPVTLHGSNVVLSPLAPELLSALLTAATEDRRHLRQVEVPADEAGMLRYLEQAEAERAAGSGLRAPNTLKRRASAAYRGPVSPRTSST